MDFSKIHVFQVVLIGVFVVLALVGVFLFMNYGGPGGGSTVVGEVEIWGTLPGEGVGEGLTELSRGHREYLGVTYIEKTPETFDLELAEALASGTGPVLILISQEELMSQKNKLELISYETISEREYLDAYLPIFELFMSGEGVYGIPVAVDPLVLFYNTTMLEAAGVAEPPATWEAISGLVSVLTRKLPDQTITRSAIALGEYENVTHARGIVSTLLMQSGNVITRVADTGDVRSVLAAGAGGIYGITPAESAMNFYTQYANPSKTVYSWNRSLLPSRQAFLAGDVALYLGYASEVDFLSAGNPNLEFDMARMPQPQTADTRITYGKGYVLALPKASKNPDGALRVAFALSDSRVARVIAEALSMAPAVSKELSAKSTDRYAPIFYPDALIARGWLSPSPRVTDTIFGTMIGNITSGRREISDALSAADQALDAAI